MWFSYSIANHQYQVQGMYEQRLGQRVLCFSNDAARLNDIRDLADSEYQQAVELDQMRRKVSFGRDYLGHYPLFYAQTGDDIVISDDVHLIKDWLAARHIEVTISSHAIGFYLSMGYVPQGYTLFNEIHSCRNATLYHWENGKVTEQNLFSAVEIDSSCHIDDVASELNTELDKLFKQNQELDVWCSGGLDSAIIAMLCNQGERKADLLTLKHASDFRGTVR